jgi:hypothetical protein
MVSKKENPDPALFALLAGFTTCSPNAEVTTLRALDHCFLYVQSKDPVQRTTYYENWFRMDHSIPVDRVERRLPIFAMCLPTKNRPKTRVGSGRFHHLLARTEVTRLQVRVQRFQYY